jgi:RimJ/RimL family protein N-acetyltransferase
VRYAPGMHIFDTARLRLRPIGEQDEALYCRLYTDGSVMRFIAPALSQEVARRSFSVALRQQARHPQRWILAERCSGDDVGMVALVGEGDGPEIGVMVLVERHGLGYGHESMAALVDRAFASERLTSITARQSVVDNPTVVRMMLALGFSPIPPTPERPAGGDWVMQRANWLMSGRASAPVATDMASG